MRPEFLRAAAEAYATISIIESYCYHYLHGGFNTSIQAELVKHYTSVLLANSIPDKFIDRLVSTAISECHYPVNESTGFAWSGNQRASVASIPKATWSRNQLCKQVNFIIDDMRRNSRAAMAAIESQLASA